MAVLTLGVCLRLPMPFGPPARGNEPVRRGSAVELCADDGVRGAWTCAFGEAWWRRVALDGDRNQCRHDEARSLHRKEVLLTFQFLFRHRDNCKETEPANARARACNCTKQIPDAAAIADSADCARLVTARRRWLQRSGKTFSFFAAFFGTSLGNARCDAITAGVEVRATIRGSPGAAVWEAKARRAIISSEAGDGGDGG